VDSVGAIESSGEVTGQKDTEVLLANQQGVEFRPWGVLLHERDVEVPAAQAGQLCRHRQVTRYYSRARVLGGELGDHAKQVTGQFTGNAQSDDTGGVGGGGGDGAHHLVVPHQDGTRLCEQGDADLGGSDAGAAAHQQLHTELAFQGADRL
jgi:hypothetical protein